MTMDPPPRFGIGHNGPPDPALRWRKLHWVKAKAALRPPPLSQVQLKFRMARAEELGLTYAQYASIRMATGRDPAALLFSPQGLGLRLTRRISLPPATLSKLARLRGCALLALAPEGERAEEFLEELRGESGLAFAGAAPLPAPGAGWGATRAAILPMLAAQSLPSGSTLLIGRDDGSEPGWAAALGQPFLPAAAYFAP